MCLGNIFGGDNNCLCILAILAFVVCVLGDDILDCLGNLDTCAIICIVLFILYCCGALNCGASDSDDDKCCCN